MYNERIVKTRFNPIDFEVVNYFTIQWTTRLNFERFGQLERTFGGEI